MRRSPPLGGGFKSHSQYCAMYNNPGSTIGSFEQIAMLTDFKKHLDQLQLESVFRDLGVSDPTALARTVKHFTTKEGEKRDKIVLDYFGKGGIERIVDVVTEFLLEPPKLPENPKILDVGAGSGFFTVKVAKKVLLKCPKADFYALDLTPAMLLSLAKKKIQIAPFIGIAENIKGSIEHARSYCDIPLSFDAVFSTLMLHHSTEPERVFESIQKVLKANGKAMIVDMMEHSFKEFKAQMGDVHLGFKLESVYEMAQKHFPAVQIEKISGICCECLGRSAEIFAAVVRNRA